MSESSGPLEPRFPERITLGMEIWISPMTAEKLTDREREKGPRRRLFVGGKICALDT